MKQINGGDARQWLIEIRGSLSQASVAEKCGITQQYYSRIELGTRTPAVPQAKAIAKALGFNWQRFYLEPGDKQGTSTSATG